MVCVGYCVQEAAVREKKEEVRDPGTCCFEEGLRNRKKEGMKKRGYGKFFAFFFGPHPQHEEVLGPGIELEP